MFTGLVEGKARVRRVEARGSGLRLVLEPSIGGFEAAPGQSIAVSGACLSVVPDPAAGKGLCFDLSAETLARTWFGELREGMELNLERALQLGERLDGHLVSGHVDGVGRLVRREGSGDGGELFEFEAPAGFERWLVEKGSVTVDGISLTVVRPQGRRFSAALIPLTLERTTLGSACAGAPVNLEADAIGKWVERLLDPRTR
jgi:riboflavin synthase